MAIRRASLGVCFAAATLALLFSGIAAGQNAFVGNYSDSIIVTLTY